MFTQNLSGRLETDSQVIKTDSSPGVSHDQVCVLPVGLPDVDCLRVINAVFLSHVIQEVKEKSDSDWRRTLRTKDGHKDIVHKLLQRPLQW